MTESNKKTVFPSNRPMKEMGQLAENGTIENLQITTKQGEVLVDQPANISPSKIIPKAFKLPFRAMGVGVSTVAKILGIRVVIDISSDREKTEE